jgi:hypothetical protein
MINQIAYIEKKQHKLNQTDFCKWLRDEKIIFNDKTAFIPAMSFFVLGFRDILRYLEYKTPQNEIEMMINTHCQEDSFHWKWFLSDMEKLGFGLHSWGSSVTDLLDKMWSDEDIPMRDMVYETFILINHHNNPKLSLNISKYL